MPHMYGTIDTADRCKANWSGEERKQKQTHLNEKANVRRLLKAEVSHIIASNSGNCTCTAYPHGINDERKKWQCGVDMAGGFLRKPGAPNVRTDVLFNELQLQYIQAIEAKIKHIAIDPENGRGRALSKTLGDTQF